VAPKANSATLKPDRQLGNLGEWNNMVIECVDREIKVWVNGDLVNYGYDCTADRGQIAIQAEGSEVEFRKLVLTPIKKLTK
jgi:hypothetical protein